MKYHIQEGFGPIDQQGQAPACQQCWGVRLVKATFATAEEASDFADKWYERKIKKIDSDDWKSYWVRVLNV
jgi:hypothetical protein